MDDMTEKMLASSTIDDPVETRKLFLEMEASLPISIRFVERSVKGLQQQLPDLEITKDQVFSIEKLLYSGDAGGILRLLISRSIQVILWRIEFSNIRESEL